MNKEELYLIAIKNLIKKNNLLQLAIELEQGIISEEDYFKIIDESPEKYVIETKNIQIDEEHLFLFFLNNIVQSLKQEFKKPIGCSDIEDIFSLRFNYDNKNSTFTNG